MTIAYLCYHEIAEAWSNDVYAVSAPQLRRSVFRLKSAFETQSFHLTFDDAHVSHCDLVFPILEEAGLKGIFFVPTAWIGKRVGAARWQQLRALQQAGHTLGSHTHTHPLLTQLSASAVQAELTRSREILEEQLSTSIHSVSLPGGRGNDAIIEACRAAGFTDIFDSYPVGPTSSRPGVHGRLVVRHNTSDEVLMDYVAGDRKTLHRLQRAYRFRAGLKELIGDETYQMMWRLLFRRQPEVGLAERY